MTTPETTAAPAPNGTSATPVASTALAVRPAAPPPAPPDQGGAINVFASASNYGVAQRMALGLAASNMVPEAYQAKSFDPKGVPTDTLALGNCMIAIELASRIGCSVFMVMQNLDVIHGRPGFRSVFLIATVNASGRFTPLRFRWEGTEGKDDWGCRAVAKDKDSGEECVGTRITIGLSKAEGWYGRKGSKWQTLPELMLQYRAAAFWTRVFAPELSMGMQTVEEVADFTGGGLADLPSTFTAASTKILEQQLMGTAAAVVEPPSSPAVASTTKGEPPPPDLPEPAKADPPVDDTKSSKRGKAQASLPTGELLQASGKPEAERDPLTGEIVPPAVTP